MVFRRSYRCVNNGFAQIIIIHIKFVLPFHNQRFRDNSDYLLSTCFPPGDGWDCTREDEWYDNSALPYVLDQSK